MQTLSVKADQTPAEIVRIPCAALSTVNAGTGHTGYAQAVVCRLLMDTLDYFGIAWTKVQTSECAALWASEYYWMSMAEIKLFLVKLKTGQYTKTDYRHLSPFQLMGWLDGFANELLVHRANYFEEREAAERHQKEIERMTDPNMMAFDAVKALEAMGFNPDDLPKDNNEKEEIYRQEKIKQRQREALRNSNIKSNENGNVQS